MLTVERVISSCSQLDFCMNETDLICCCCHCPPDMNLLFQQLYSSALLPPPPLLHWFLFLFILLYSHKCCAFLHLPIIHDRPLTIFFCAPHLYCTASFFLNVPFTPVHTPSSLLGHHCLLLLICNWWVEHCSSLQHVQFGRFFPVWLLHETTYCCLRLYTASLSPSVF